MFELTINGEVYSFKFGMGFLREINKSVSIPVEGMAGVKKDVGLRYAVTKLYEGDIETLEEVLDIANKTQTPRVTKLLLDGCIEDEDTDIDALFEEVMGFLETANATKKETQDVLKAIEMEKEKQKEKQKAEA